MDHILATVASIHDYIFFVYHHILAPSNVAQYSRHMANSQLSQKLKKK